MSFNTLVAIKSLSEGARRDKLGVEELAARIEGRPLPFLPLLLATAIIEMNEFEDLNQHHVEVIQEMRGERSCR